MTIGDSNNQMHFSIPKMPDFLDDDKVEMVLTEESKQYFERARPKQGFVGIVELCPDEVTSSGKKLAKIHLIPADNKESGALAGIDKEGKKLDTLSSLQRLGTFTGDLHMRAAGALGLGEKGGANGLLMGFGIWKSGCGIKFLDYLPPREALIPNEYLLVKENGEWNLYFTGVNAKFSPEASPRLISEIPGLQDALDRLPSEKSLYSLTYEERLEIETLLRNTKEGKKEKEGEIGAIKNRSSSQNMYSINHEDRNAQLYKAFYNMSVKFHNAHVTQFARELPFSVFEKIVKNTTQQLPGVPPIVGLVEGLNSTLSKTIMGDINGPLAHLKVEQQWMKMTQEERESLVLYAAINLNKPEIIEHLINLNVNPNKPIMRQGVIPIPLMFAIDKSFTEACLALINNGADLNKIDIRGEAPLTIAAKSGLTEVCLALIKKGANVDTKNRDLETPLLIAVRQNNVEICLELIRAGATYDDKTLKKMREFIDDQELDDAIAVSRASSRQVPNDTITTEDVNAKDSSGKTPLMIAVEQKNADLFLELIRKGADVNAKDNSGKTPLMYAMRKFLTGFSLRLIEAGADVNAKDNDGEMPLMIAAERDLIEVFRALIEAGADMNVKSKYGTPLLIIAFQNRAYQVAQLIQNSATAERKESRKPAMTQKFDQDRATSPSPSSELPTSPKSTPRRK